VANPAQCISIHCLCFKKYCVYQRVNTSNRELICTKFTAFESELLELLVIVVVAVSFREGL
jgi:hypothetical protein